jgi:hypothetical protein
MQVFVPQLQPPGPFLCAFVKQSSVSWPTAAVRGLLALLQANSDVVGYMRLLYTYMPGFTKQSQRAAVR